MPKRKRARSKNSSNRLAARKRGASSHSASRQRVTRDSYQNSLVPFIALMLVTFLAYANAWPNDLIWDDRVFEMNERLPHLLLTDIGQFFTQNVWASIGVESSLYRPLLLVSVALDMLIFGEWKAGYHLVNIFLHALVTLTVYGLIRHLLTALGAPLRASGQAALMAAMIFAVHPVHTEVVNSVFNRSELLATLFLSGGIWWFLGTVGNKPRKAWTLLAAMYLLALFSRETGIVLPAIAVIVLWFTTTGNWKVRVRRCLPVFCLLVPLAFYIALRVNALEPPAVLEAPVILNEVAVESPAVSENKLKISVLDAYADFSNFLPATAVWFDSMWLMVWPNPLLTFHDISQTNHWFALIFQTALFVFAVYRAVRGKPVLLIGLAFFYLALLPTSRIVGEANVTPHLAERYLYLPSVGAAIILGYGTLWLLQKTTTRLAISSVLCLLMILTPLTWARNSKWVSDEVLAKTDMEQGGRAAKLRQAYISALLRDGKLHEAGKFCDANDQKVSSWGFFASYCGQVYAVRRDYEKAEKAFMAAIDRRTGNSSVHFALAVMYLDQGRHKEAAQQFEKAVSTENRLFMREYLEAEKLIRLFPSNRERLIEARVHLEKSIELQPQFFQSRKKLDEIDRVINRRGQR